MARSFRLEKVLELYELRVEEAAETLARINKTLAQARDRLEQLQHFAREYQQTHMTKMQSGISVSQLEDFEAFLIKLNQAVRQQGTVVAEVLQRQTTAQSFWREKRQEADAIKLLKERHRQELLYQEGRREQRLFDEFAAVSWRRNQPQKEDSDDSEDHQ